MKKNPLLWGALIGVLLLLNLWKWLPALKGGKAGSSTSSFAGLQLNLPSPPEGEDREVRRDLFSMAMPVKPRLVQVPRVVIHLEPSPQPTPIGLAADGSIMEASGGYRLMGTASREGKNQALIGLGDKVFQVKPGDDLDGRYKVGEVTENEVYLTEAATGNTLKLRIWDPTKAP